MSTSALCTALIEDIDGTDRDHSSIADLATANAATADIAETNMSLGKLFRLYIQTVILTFSLCPAQSSLKFVTLPSYKGCPEIINLQFVFI